MKDMVNLTGSHDFFFVSLRHIFVRSKRRHWVVGSGWTVRGLNPCRGKTFTSSPQWTGFGTRSVSYSAGTGDLSRG